MRFDYVTFDVPGDLPADERRAFALGLAADLFGKRCEVEVVGMHGGTVRVRRARQHPSREDRRAVAWL